MKSTNKKQSLRSGPEGCLMAYLIPHKRGRLSGSMVSGNICPSLLTHPCVGFGCAGAELNLPGSYSLL